MQADHQVAIIGAGLAGLSCAAALAAAGHAPVVYDKSRGLGGRLASRRWADGRFDHGCQYVAPKNAGFTALLDRLHAAGAVAEWGDGRLVGVPGMSGLVAPLADGLDLRRGTEVQAVTRDGAGWAVQAGDTTTTYDRVVIAIPGPQVPRIAPFLADAVAPVEMSPCLTAMLAFATALDLPDIPEELPESLGWVVRDSAKPGRRGEGWVIQATADWSQAHLELEKPEIAARLLAEFQGVVGQSLPEPLYQAGHRWRYAIATRPLGMPYLAEGGLYLAGDWCLGARAEQAWESGAATAAAVLEELV